MKSWGTIVLALAVALNLALTAWLLTSRAKTAPDSDTTTSELDLKSLRKEVQTLQAQLHRLETTQPATAEAPAPAGDVDATPGPDLTARLDALDDSVARLRQAMDGVSIDASSEERAAQFAGENGHLKADEYFEAGKFAIAGEGYLRFLEHHPDHPDHKNILERARNSFTRAGYTDKALWAQEELMRIYPENPGQDLMALAHLEKNAKRYGAAARHAAESAQHLESGDRYWNLLYAAWYTQLADGNAAGLQYYRDVERQINDAGLGDQRVGERAREKIEELERQLAGGN